MGFRRAALLIVLAGKLILVEGDYRNEHGKKDHQDERRPGENIAAHRMREGRQETHGIADGHSHDNGGKPSAGEIKRRHPKALDEAEEGIEIGEGQPYIANEDNKDSQRFQRRINERHGQEADYEQREENLLYLAVHHLVGVLPKIRNHQQSARHDGQRYARVQPRVAFGI